MNNTYQIINRPLKDLLDSIDSFVSNMKQFTDNHKGYSYEIKIHKSTESLWSANITVIHQKREHYKTFRKAI